MHGVLRILLPASIEVHIVLLMVENVSSRCSSAASEWEKYDVIASKSFGSCPRGFKIMVTCELWLPDVLFKMVEGV